MDRTRGAVLVLVLLVLFGAGCVALKRLAYEGFGRDSWQQPERVIGELGLRPGDQVADLGAGSGYFTFRLADAVGASGRVYAVDIDSAMLDYLTQQAIERGYRNIEPVLAAPDDPRLPEAGIDLIFICDTYHHLDDRVAYFRHAARYLRPSGRIAIVDFNDRWWFTWLIGHWSPADQIRREMQAAGYRLDSEHDVVERQSFLIFSRASAEEQTTLPGARAFAEEAGQLGWSSEAAR